ncbi:MAG: stage V sporulation protein D [Desulfitibacter sp. BRH_c19]|nr:MAG: stage V sporulation protein D [Desulfitibacter sp. BRH_c19]
MTGNVVMKKRIAKVFLLFFAAFFFLSFRLVWIQFVRGDELQLQALDNRLREVPVEPKRGTIFDRNMRELAISVSADYIYAIPPQVNRSGKAQEIAEELSKILDIPVENVYNRITKNGSWFEYVVRKVDYDKATAIRELNLPGINVAEESQRFYPNDHLAAHVLGFAGIDNQGLEGIEVIYDEELNGKRGAIVVEYDAAGREIPHAMHQYIPPEDGNSLVLTIDETIQFIAERELDTLMASTSNPKSATIIVMDPQSGEILALASRPTYDPNNYSQYPQENWRNIAVSNSYEPGSTFKVVTTSAVLEEGLVGENEKFVCTGSIRVGGETIKCWRYYNPHGSQTFSVGVQNSCNPTFITLGLRLEDKQKGNFYNYIRDFGFGSITGLDLPGEASGIMIQEENLKQVNIATISIGQGIAVTPVQLASAMSAIANNGTLLKPHLVREIRDKDGNLVKAIEPEVVKQVISKETAQETLGILEEVVSEGTGRNGYIEGYRVGGKTGTAQKAGAGGYLQGRYVASFLGVAPVDDPKLVALVVIDEPQGYPYYGGTVAAPIFKRVVEDSLHYLGVAPQYNPDEKEQTENQQISLPDLTGLSIDKAEQALRSLGLIADFRGNGTIIKDQNPAAMAKVTPGTTIILQLEEGEATEMLKVPDISGYRVYQAANVLEAMGLKLVPEGSGSAIEQNPKPNSNLEPGSEVNVIFQE